MKALDEVLPLAERERIRRDAMGTGFYSPWLHLAVTSVFGLALIVGAALLIRDLKWWHAGFGAVLFVLSNAVEWRVHRDFLHKRQKVAPILYDRHTPQHHMVFVTDDMEIRNVREFKLVLLPAFAIVLIFLSLVPIIAMIWFGWPGHFFSDADQHNLACVFAIETMGYVVSYEWLHLSYHLPRDSFIGRIGLIRVLARHHAVHHHPRLMQKWNFNVSLPLWDWVRRTIVSDERKQAVLAAEKA